MFWHIVVGVSLLKLLLIPQNVSIDFEVHRNWLAITHSLPVEQWYVDTTSSWSLDYPPLFAWFEWFLSQFATWFDPQILQVQSQAYTSYETKAFQRLSVVLTDLTMAYGLSVCFKVLDMKPTLKTLVLAFIFTNAELVMLDHLHFHYTGFFLGLILASIGHMFIGNHFISAAIYVLTISLNQTCLFYAPVYFIYLLTTCCNPWKKNLVACLLNLSLLAAIVILGLAIPFGPFIYYQQLPILFYRIFPLGRGLVQPIYWAPNFWAFYNGLDTALMVIVKYFDPSFDPDVHPLLVDGVVQDSLFALVPVITPVTTILVILCVLGPVFRKLWLSPERPLQFLHALVLCAYTCFMFGW